MGLSPGTDLALYADDTKIWRSISCETDYEILQNDIDYLHQWARQNKMKLHPFKCKIVTIHSRPLTMLPFTQYHYQMGENLLEFVDCETDLGAYIDSDLDFNLQRESLLTEANQQYVLVKRTRHFVNDIKRR